MSVILHNVEFIDSSEATQLPHSSNLTAIEDMGIDAIPFSCRSGCCGSCVVEVVDGAKNLSDPQSEERDFLLCLGYAEEHYRLACQCQLKGSVVLKKVV